MKGHGIQSVDRQSKTKTAAGCGPRTSRLTLFAERARHRYKRYRGCPSVSEPSTQRCDGVLLLMRLRHILEAWPNRAQPRRGDLAATSPLK